MHSKLKENLISVNLDEFSSIINARKIVCNRKENSSYEGNLMKY